MPNKVPFCFRSPKKVTRGKIRKGLNFQALAANGSIDLDLDCRKADCGVCIIKVNEGAENLSPAEAREADFLKAMNALPQERLACQCRVFGPIDVEVEF